MPGWMYRKTKQPNLGSGAYTWQIKAVQRGKKKHTVFQRPFNLNLQFH